MYVGSLGPKPTCQADSNAEGKAAILSLPIQMVTKSRFIAGMRSIGQQWPMPRRARTGRNALGTNSPTRCRTKRRPRNGLITESRKRNAPVKPYTPPRLD
jgi:hypothetical protein